MSIFKVCYEPDFSSGFKKLIIENITPSMKSDDETTGQFSMDSVNADVLHDLQYDLSEEDVKELANLVEQDVEFIELVIR